MKSLALFLSIYIFLVLQYEDSRMPWVLMVQWCGNTNVSLNYSETDFIVLRPNTYSNTVHIK